MARHKHVINISEIDEKEVAVGDKFHHAVKGLGSSTGGVQLGCSYFRVAAGRYAFPLHSHNANEEAIYILEGSGTLTLGPDEIPVSAGDYASMPPDRDLPHKLVNTGGFRPDLPVLVDQYRPGDHRISRLGEDWRVRRGRLEPSAGGFLRGQGRFRRIRA